MQNIEQYLIWGCILLLLFCIIYLFKWRGKRKALGGARQYMLEALQAAIEQKSGFDIKLKNGSSRSGLTATLDAFSRSGLNLLCHGLVTEEWDKKEVEVFFRVSQPEGPVFYVFDSSVLKINPGPENSALILALPSHLRVEKKRHFARVSPNPKDILMIAVWPVAPGRRLPRSNSDMGKPAISWKNGQKDETAQVENISGGGVAIRFQTGEKGELPFPSAKGRQLICLLVYKPPIADAKPVIFWCSGEIMNVRKAGYALALGLEFTNWAIQEQGSVEIHWTHSSPWQGSKPILAWVEQIDKARN